MGGKSAPTPPPVPDPRAIAQADAEFNRIDQFTPFGSLQFSGPNRNISTLEFSPEQQALFEQQQGIDQGLLGQSATRLGGLDPNQINLDQFGPIQSGFDTSNINFGTFGQGGDQFGGGGVGGKASRQGNVSAQREAFQKGGFQAPGGQPQGGGLPNIDPRAFGLGPGQQQQFQQNLDTSGLPEIPQDFGAFRNRIEDSLFNRGERLLSPQFQRQEDRLRQTLANQGLFAGDEAAGDQFQIFGENRNRAFQDLADQSVLRGGQEASRQFANILGARQQGFGEQLGAGQFRNQAIGQQLGASLGAFGAGSQGRGQLQGEQGFNNQVAQQRAGLAQQQLLNANAGRSQGISEQQNIRGTAFNELASLLGLQQTQTPSQSDFFGPGQVDVLGANALSANQAQQNFQGQLLQQQGALGGLFGLGSSLLGAGGAAGGFGTLFSDRRLKKNITRIGAVNGHKWYSFDFLWGEHSQGVMSDEIPQEFVGKRLGFDTVDYGALLGNV